VKITPARIVMLLLTLAIVVGLVYAFMPQPIRVQTAVIQHGQLQVTVNEDGRTRIKDRYIVSAPLSGQLQRIGLRAGDAVHAGHTVLAEIVPGDPALLDARALAEAEARVRRAEAALLRVGPELEQNRAALDYAENELTSVTRAHQRGGATDRELEMARLAYRRAVESFSAAQFAQDIARYEVELAQAALLRTHPEQSPAQQAEYMVLRSPIDGRVLRVLQESMAVVSPGMALLELGDPTDLEIEIDVLSSDAVRIRPGADVQIEHWGGEHTLHARVRLIEPQAFTRVSALGVEEQRVNIIADFVDPPAQREALGDGYRVEARIVVWEEQEVLLVPTSALFRIGGQWGVYVKEGDRARLRQINLGRQSAMTAQVLAGLAAGDEVIVHPGDLIHDGVRIVRR